MSVAVGVWVEVWIYLGWRLVELRPATFASSNQSCSAASPFANFSSCYIEIDLMGVIVFTSA